MVKAVTGYKSQPVQTGTAKAGWILSLVGGILGILSSLFVLMLGIFFASFLPEEAAPEGAAIGIIFIVVAIYCLITAVLTIIGAVWMRQQATQFRGSIVVLVCGVIGAGTLFGLIGGILGLVDHSQRTKGR
ncbi:hypothetical protein HYS47_01520 [Candidatus Woesearchaeota archaeon]|nr:hypothetical protein [Candidatus Woesearchaeota archaeon]